MSGIWLSDNKFMEFAEFDRSALCTELATRLGGFSGAWAGTWLGILPDPDPVLRKSGDGIDALEALAADYKVMSCMQTRKLKTLGRDSYDFSPGALPGGEPTPEAVALCDMLRRDLERIDLYHLISEILDAPYYGLTVAEALWQADGTGMRLKGLVPKPAKWFVYDGQNRLRLIGDNGLLYWREDGAQALEWDGAGLLPPDGKFIVARHFPTYQNPYGLRLLSRCLFPVAFKRGGVEFMMRFAEKWGMPWVFGKGRPGATDAELARMRDALAGMVRDAVAVVNAGAEVEIVESSGKAGDVHLSMIRHWDEAIAQVLVGQTLTSSIGEAGSYAASKTHEDVLDAYMRADATLVKIFFDELAWVYGQINAPGVLTPTFAFDEPEDQRERAELGEKLHAQGVRFTPVYFERRFGLARDEFTLAREEGSAPGAAFAAPESGKSGKLTPGQQSLDALVEEMLPRGVQGATAMASEILKLVEAAESPEDLETLLAEALLPADKGGVSMADFAQVVEAALFAADMVGQYSGRENVV